MISVARNKLQYSNQGLRKENYVCDLDIESYLKAEALVLRERQSQSAKWSTENAMISASPTHHSYLKTKMVVLMEEVGELAKEILEKNDALALEEAVQVAAVAMAIVEGLVEINAK